MHIYNCAPQNGFSLFPFGLNLITFLKYVLESYDAWNKSSV